MQLTDKTYTMQYHLKERGEDDIVIYTPASSVQMLTSSFVITQLGS